MILQLFRAYTCLYKFLYITALQLGCALGASCPAQVLSAPLFIFTSCYPIFRRNSFSLLAHVSISSQIALWGIKRSHKPAVVGMESCHRGFVRFSNLPAPISYFSYLSVIHEVSSCQFQVSSQSPVRFAKKKKNYNLAHDHMVVFIR
ncbi:hypothetical protein J3R30DRAFT_1346652 [Lentinula aciculospora]|uniref:Uncharacterized protein n=1 Tax=Lentinula aciculospora TaxID=153920 RepID=A0A9W9AL63_9AGAR|nr:hypothetical protein J3R30DRAFT_1346652 [Lentinula aciculospora]